MIRDHNIVCIANSWFDHPTSKHHVMRMLAAANRVLWVNFHASRRPQFNAADLNAAVRRLSRVARGTRQAARNIEVLSPLLIPLPEWAAARRFNAWRVGRSVRDALARGAAAPTQLWLFTPDIPELIPRMHAERTVYYCVDDFAAFAGFNAALIERLEARTLAWSDVVITTSAKLYERCRRSHPNVHFVAHGVDYAHFARTPTLPADQIPADVRDVRRPAFGYTGLIADYVDLELIGAIARQRPDWTFVLIGDVRRDVAPVANLANVRLLGPRSYASLPAYYRALDVGLIPFRMTRLVQSVNPIKLREYLAAGLPVVSTPLEECQRHAPAVQTAESAEGFIAACEAALEQARVTPASERQKLVTSESWESRIELLSDIVDGRQRTAPPPPIESRPASLAARTPKAKARVGAASKTPSAT